MISHQHFGHAIAQAIQAAFASPETDEMRVQYHQGDDRGTNCGTAAGFDLGQNLIVGGQD